MPAASVDAVVTDPPYGLKFMGKKFDDLGEGAQQREWHRLWAVEALRVLKPGGYLLAMGGSRTYHHLASGIEEAGFEIRDRILYITGGGDAAETIGPELAWIYGSGFPKSLDVGKAIDGSDRAAAARVRALEFTVWLRSTGISANEVNALTGTVDMARHALARDSQPSVLTADLFDKLRPWLAERAVAIPGRIEKLVAERTVESENMRRREVVGSGFRVHRHEGAVPYGCGTPDGDYDITAPATPEAQNWAGWGTALKPAHEPICVARKPLVGTVAANVLAHGTGALNIDGCRIPGDVPSVPQPDFSQVNGQRTHLDAYARNGRMSSAPQGRWPANVILDEDAAAALDEQSGESRSPAKVTRGAGRQMAFGMGRQQDVPCFGDTGGASRFFYVAKPGRKEREAGLDQRVE